MSSVHGPMVIRRRLGATLKQLRVQSGLHLADVARELEVSSSKLSRLETGHVAPRVRDVRDLLEIYGASADLRDRVLKWATDAKEPGWWQPFSAAVLDDLDLYISLESESRKVRLYSLPVSGLLQTEAYARMLLAGAAPYVPPDELERLIEIRIGRQAVLDPSRVDTPPLDLHVVLDQAALHRGEATTMAGQLSEILDRGRWPNITIQVLPFAAGFVMASSTFAIFEPRDRRDATVVNVESAGQDAYFDTTVEIAKYEQMWENVTASALDVESSENLIRDILVTYLQ